MCECTSRRNLAFLGGEIQLKSVTKGTLVRVSLSIRAKDRAAGSHPTRTPRRSRA